MAKRGVSQNSNTGQETPRPRDSGTGAATRHPAGAETIISSGEGRQESFRRLRASATPAAGRPNSLAVTRASATRWRQR
jgi:hypothetical protein